MWIGVIIAVGIIAYFAYGLAVIDLLPRGWSKYFADPGRLEMWLIRALAAGAIIAGWATFAFGDSEGF